MLALALPSGAISPAGFERVERPCSTAPSAFTLAVDEPASVWVAAAASAECDRCSLAFACLLDALRIDAAHRRGEDLWGVSGVGGGVAFSPGAMPRRVAGTGGSSTFRAVSAGGRGASR